MENRYCVIMGGGIGSRFWPFSRNNRPKQFLDFFGIGRSLLQMSYDRFRNQREAYEETCRLIDNEFKRLNLDDWGDPKQPQEVIGFSMMEYRDTSSRAP